MGERDGRAFLSQEESLVMRARDELYSRIALPAIRLEAERQISEVADNLR
jgi:hypothetical protein